MCVRNKETGAPGAIPTRDLPLRRRALYAAELREHMRNEQITDVSILHQNAFRNGIAHRALCSLSTSMTQIRLIQAERH